MLTSSIVRQAAPPRTCLESRELKISTVTHTDLFLCSEKRLKVRDTKPGRGVFCLMPLSPLEGDVWKADLCSTPGQADIRQTYSHEWTKCWKALPFRVSVEKSEVVTFQALPDKVKILFCSFAANHDFLSIFISAALSAPRLLHTAYVQSLCSDHMRL